MLEPILCGLISQAPLLPKLRGHFAEFLNNTSSVGLRILSSSTCVGLRYGHIWHNSGFSRQPVRMLRYFSSLHITARTFVCGFASTPSPLLVPVFPFLAHAFLLRPHSSDHMWYRNLNLLSIGYVFRPLLRPRLTQSRSALLWKPWIFGREDSHLSLATHSGILSSYPSTAPSGTASSVLRMLLYQLHSQFRSFGVVFQPRTFSAQDLSTSELLRTL